MAETDTLRAMLVRAADPPGPPPFVSGATLVARARRRRRGYWAACGGGVLAAGLATVLIVALVHPVRSPEPTLSTTSLLAGARWSELPRAPIAGREDAAAVWTGTEALIWGGLTTDPEHVALRNDGASFDPASDRWEILPAAPLSPRSLPASVWTGSEFFVWGGADSALYRDARNLDGASFENSGAMYDPVTRRWRPTAPSPLSAQAGAQAHWTGDSVVIVAGAAYLGASQAEAVVYDPGADSWTSLPEMPKRTDATWSQSVSAVGDGKLFVWVEYVNPTYDNSTDGDTADLLVMDLATRKWSTEASWPFQATIGSMAWTGSRLLMPADGFAKDSRTERTAEGGPVEAGDQRGVYYDLQSRVFRPIARGPVDGVTPYQIWTGDGILSVDTITSNQDHDPAEAAVWDAKTDSWTSLPRAPLLSRNGVRLWTGRQLLIWGQMQDAIIDLDRRPIQRTTGFRLGP